MINAYLQRSVWTLCLRATPGQCSISLSDSNRICHPRQPHAPSFHAQDRDFLFSLVFTILSSIPQLSNSTVRLYNRQKKETNDSVVCTLGKKWIVYHDRSKHRSIEAYVKNNKSGSHHRTTVKD